MAPIFPGMPPANSFLPAPATYYASPGGSDSSGDGSEFRPFRTIGKAVQVANANAGGTIRFAPNTRASTVTGVGLWLRGTFDTGIGGPGWLAVTYAISFEPWITGGGNLMFGGSEWLPGGAASAFAGPPLWISGINTGISFKNFTIAATPGAGYPCKRLGLGSPPAAYSALVTYAAGDIVSSAGVAFQSVGSGNLNHTPTLTPPFTFWTPIRAAIADGLVPSLTSMVRFDNCYFSNAGVDTGPVIDIGGGFWYFYEQCSIVRTTNGTNKLLNAGIRAYNDGSGATYYTSLTDCRMTGMGCYVVGGNEINMSRVVAENMLSMGAWHGELDVVSGSPRCAIEQVSMADSDPAIPCATNNGAYQCHAVDCDPVAGNFYTDRVAEVDSPLAKGQAGRSGPAIEVFHEGARRAHAAGTMAYKNIATALQWFTPTYVAGPDGAAAGTHTAAILDDSYDIFDESNGWDNPAAGDYFCWGVWVKWNDINPTGAGFQLSNTGTGNIVMTVGSLGGVNGGSQTIGAGESVFWSSSIPAAIGRWTWYSGMIKIVSAGASTNLVIGIGPQSAGVVSYAKPWLIHIPAADGLSIGEAAALAMHSCPVPNNGENTTAFTAVPPAPTVGFPALWPGQKIAFWDATLQAWKYISVDAGLLVVS